VNRVGGRADAKWQRYDFVLLSGGEVRNSELNRQAVRLFVGSMHPQTPTMDRNETKAQSGYGRGQRVRLRRLAGQGREGSSGLASIASAEAKSAHIRILATLAARNGQSQSSSIRRWIGDEAQDTTELDAPATDEEKQRAVTLFPGARVLLIGHQGQRRLTTRYLDAPLLEPALIG
jgi:hypothetical protein